MKSRHLIATIALILTCGSCGTGVRTQVISGRWEGADGERVRLTLTQFKDMPESSDSVTVTNGGFRFELPFDQMRMAVISFNGRVRALFLDGEPIDIVVDTTLNTGVISVSGSAEQDIMERIEHIDLLRSFSMIFGVTAEGFSSHNEEVAAFIDSNLNRQAIPFLLTRLSDLYYPVSMLEEHYNRLAPEVKSGYAARELKKTIDHKNQLSVGGTPPDIRLSDPSGNEVALSSLRGKYVLVDFWASWCGPCIGELPAIKELYAKYMDDGFEIYSVSLDDDREKWTGAISAHGLPWVHVSSLSGWECPAARAYEVTGIPKMLLLDPEGRIVAANLNGESLKNELESIFDRV